MSNKQMKTLNNNERNWQNQIAELCNNLIEYYKLPNNTIYLAENTGREGRIEDKSDKIISYSVCIYEPDYPDVKGLGKDSERNTVVMNIKISELKTKSNRFEVLVRNTATEFIGDIAGMENKGKVLGSYWRKYQFDQRKMNEVLDSWICYLKKLVGYELRTYTSKASSFACCSRFIECSDAKECVHENKLYACACYYKKNLEAGRIFYGKNQNIN